MKSLFKDYLKNKFNNNIVLLPIFCTDKIKDEMVYSYIKFNGSHDLGNILADIREQIDGDSILKCLSDDQHFNNIVYSSLEQKLNYEIFKYNNELLQDKEDAKPFNHNRAMEDAGHKHSDFM